MAAIRSYLWYVADGEISMQSIALGASKVPFIKGTQKVKETIKPDDLAALLAAPSDRSKIGIRDKTILILLYDSAIRVSELRELTLESLKLNETIPYIRVHGKGDKERIVSITDKTVEHLKRYIKIYHSETNGDYPLFYTVIKGNLSAMSTGNVERILNKYAEKIRPDHPGLPQKLYPHMLRRTRACGLYQNGVELELVSRILGHTSTQTTRIYASPSIEMLKKAMENNSVDVSETAEWLDDEEEWYEASSVIVGKSRYYAGRYSLFNGASLCVPQLHVAIFTGDTRADFMRYAAVIAMEALQLDKSIIIRHAQKIEIRCNVEDFAAELDGDAITSAPLQIELHPVPINFLA